MPTSIIIPPSASSNAVVGPASSINNSLALFDLATGKLLKDSGGISAISGALQTFGAGLGIIAGNARGTGAIDLQIKRAINLQVASGNQSALLGGENNKASGLCSVVGGGFQNSASLDYSVVLGGVNNLASGQYSAICGGNANIASGQYATAAGGASNTASGTYATVAGGSKAAAALYGQSAQASGQFSAPGDAQTSVLVARKSTIDATPTELFLDGSASRLSLVNDTTMCFEIYLVARRADSNDSSAAFLFTGAVDRNLGAATIALVGTPTKTVLSRDNVAYEADVSADTTNGSLKILVTGVVGHTIRWVARVTLVEVTG